MFVESLLLPIEKSASKKIAIPNLHQFPLFEDLDQTDDRRPPTDEKNLK
jgi:hypothetical protein